MLNGLPPQNIAGEKSGMKLESFLRKSTIGEKIFGNAFFVSSKAI